MPLKLLYDEKRGFLVINWHDEVVGSDTKEEGCEDPIFYQTSPPKDPIYWWTEEKE